MLVSAECCVLFSELALAFVHRYILVAASCVDDFVNTES